MSKHVAGKPVTVPKPENAYRPKDMGIAYILLVIGGIFGLHRHYLGRSTSAFTMTILTILGVGIPVTFIWTIVDLFLVPRIYREETETFLFNRSQPEPPNWDV